MPGYIHGGTGTRLYNIYHNMINRCYNPNNPRFKHYGGRGITVCDSWLTSFLEFQKWSMNNGYAYNLTIDRRDNNLSYSPENCQWITNQKQQLNRSNNRNITHKGETKTITEWANENGLHVKTLQGRIDSGWNLSKAIDSSVMPKIKDLTGLKFGRITVISLAKSGNFKTTWNCICECGTAKIIIGDSLVCGNTKSCGCLQREASFETAKNINHDKPIIQLDRNGNFLAEFKSPIDAHKKTGVSKSCIVAVANKSEYSPGKIRSQAGGFVWKYKEVKPCC